MTYPPRMMKRKTAAAYCDLSEAAFEREVAAGRFPAPVRLGNQDHWDRLAIDKAIDVLSGASPEPAWRRNLYGPQAA